MGFTNKPTRFKFPIRHRLIIGKPEGSLWGIGLPNEIISCDEQAIEGILIGFQLVDEKTRGGQRLLIFLEDQQTGEVDQISAGFCSRQGSYTNFAKSFCLSLISPEANFAKAITLVPNGGRGDTAESAKVVFCSVYQDGQRLKTQWDSDVNCLEILERLSPNFPKVALRYLPTTSSESDLFSEEEEFDERAAILNEQDVLMRRCQVSVESARNYCQKAFGKSSRQAMSLKELEAFTAQLKAMAQDCPDF